jgi:trimeric autotransporter adhesin
MYRFIRASVIASMGSGAPVAAQPCEWLPLDRGVDGGIHALTVFDDGAGPAIYAGGGFQAAGGRLAFGVARWDGESWSAAGAGFRDGTVYSLAVFDDGSGTALYAGGSFETSGGQTVRGIAKWNGSSWTEVGGGIVGGASKPAVRALCVFDDGSGPALYAGGTFGGVGGVPDTSFIARWDGESWSSVGGGMHSWVYALAVHDDGVGPALYAGGTFLSAGGVPAQRIAKWDGVSWSALGEGLDRYPWALAAFDDGSGSALYVGGTFTLAGGAPIAYLAKWDGSSWSDVGGGVDKRVSGLGVFDRGRGDELYVGGNFTTAGGLPISGLALWDGEQWSALPGGEPGLTAVSARIFADFDDGSGPRLHAAGGFWAPSGLPEYIARLDCATCPADCDGSGDLTFFDFLCFQNLFAAMDPGADCDGDGEFTFFDFLCFQNAFAAGCS